MTLFSAMLLPRIVASPSCSLEERAEPQGSALSSFPHHGPQATNAQDAAQISYLFGRLYVSLTRVR